MEFNDKIICILRYLDDDYMRKMCNTFNGISYLECERQREGKRKRERVSATDITPHNQNVNVKQYV